MRADTDERLRFNTTWLPDARNPVLPPSEPAFDARVCMNPWVMRSEDTYELFYAGEGDDGRRRICLATTPVTDLAAWRRLGPQFDRGEHGDFDGAWCVLPHVVNLDGERRRIYYTGNSGIGRSLDRFPGLGFAEARPQGPYVKYPGNPVIAPSRHDGDPDALGIAGGSVLHQPDGDPAWLFYYTGCPTVGDDVFLDQQKTICLATSADGVEWHKHGAVLLRRPDHDYEDIAVAGPVVRRHPSGLYQMWYSAIGTRWGYYSICYAESADGLSWNRGTSYGDNLQLGPAASSDGSWDSQMVEYPSVVDEQDHVRLFYAGNGYGRTGIGTAISTPLRVTSADTGDLLVSCSVTGRGWVLGGAVELDAEPQLLQRHHDANRTPWNGPDARATLWSEHDLVDGVSLRRIVTHTAAGAEFRTTMINGTDRERTVHARLVVRSGDRDALTLSPDRPMVVPPRSSASSVQAITLS